MLYNTKELYNATLAISMNGYNPGHSKKVGALNHQRNFLHKKSSVNFMCVWVSEESGAENVTIGDLYVVASETLGILLGI